ncbi:hypothetical protein YN1_8640 [Nanoarchaeota archaeon]
MAWKKILPLLLLFIFLLKIHGEQPIVGYPQIINNQINISNPSSYAQYVVELYNPTNYTYYYTFSPLSSQWNFIFGENDKEISGYLYPGNLVNVTIYLRPYGLENQIPQVVVYLENENITSQYYSYILQFTPVVYYVQSEYLNITHTQILPISISFQISATVVTQNSYLYLIEIVNNPNNITENVFVNISTDFGVSENYKELAQPGVNIYQIPIYVQKNVSIGEHYIYILANNQTYTVAFSVTQLPTIPNITVYKENYLYKIIIKNPYSYPINYTYYLKNYFGIFSQFSPNPSYIITVNGSEYGVYRLLLLPDQEIIIYESFNYYYLIGIIVVAIIIVLAILYILFKDNVIITKEVSRIDMKNETVDIEITIKNKSLFSLNNVTLTEYINKPLKIKEYKIAEPSSVYKSENNYIINWKFDNIRRNEEIVLSYTAEIKDLKDYKNIEISRSNIKYKYLFWDRSKYSNGLVIRITK